MRGVGGAQHAEGLEGLLAGAVQDRVGGSRRTGIRRRLIRELGAAGEVCGAWATAKSATLLRERWRVPCRLKGPWDLRAEGDGAEGRWRARSRRSAARARLSQPSEGGFDAGGAGLHVVLRVEVGAGGVF